MNLKTFKRGEVKAVSLGIAVLIAFIAYAAISVPRAHAFSFWPSAFAFFFGQTRASYFGYSNYGNGGSSSGSSIWTQQASAAGAAGGAGGSISGGGSSGANGGAVGGQGGSGGSTSVSTHSNINSSSVRVQ